MASGSHPSRARHHHAGDRTADPSGETQGRMLARLEHAGRLDVSAHHSPRGWYRRAVAQPDAEAEIDGVVADCTAVPVVGDEFERVAASFPPPLGVRFLKGFPPDREILRLIPATTEGA